MRTTSNKGCDLTQDYEEFKMRKIYKAKSTIVNVEKMEKIGFVWGSVTVNAKTGWTIECWSKEDQYVVIRK